MLDHGGFPPCRPASVSCEGFAPAIWPSRAEAWCPRGGESEHLNKGEPAGAHAQEQASMGAGMSKVVEGLYLGSIRDAEDKATLEKHGITHILSVHNNAKPVLEGMTYLCISASDSSNQNLMQHFKECIRFVHECRLNGEGCLIHCLAGVSRSTTILVAYLMTVTRFGWEECLAATQAVRPYVSPNVGFREQLREYEMALLKENRGWIEREYGRNPLSDQEDLQRLLSHKEEKTKEQAAELRGTNRLSAPSLPNHRPHTTHSRSGNSTDG